ncbi:hypothetical protein M885DRAFT_413555, partial [Pelagophyceae sp. CCMP2097]
RPRRPSSGPLPAREATPPPRHCGPPLDGPETDPETDPGPFSVRILTVHQRPSSGPLPAREATPPP